MNFKREPKLAFFYLKKMLKSEKKIVDQIFKKVVQCLHLFKSFKHFFMIKKEKL